MKSRNEGLFAKSLVLLAALLLMLPSAALAQGRGRGRGKPTEVFVNGHDARDGRTDRDDQRRGRRDRDDDDWRDDRRRRDDDDDDWRGDRRRRDDDWRNDGRRRERRRGRDWDGYGNYGGSYQLRQTALNAGYNEGIKEGRRDRDRGDRYDFRDESAYRNASKDYNSRLGDRYAYERYFREAFENGYRDGWNGY